MKLPCCIILLLLCSFASFAQPRWSGEIRAKRETEWMNEKLRLSKKQLAKVSSIELNFNQRMDKAGESPKTQHKMQQRLMRQKDANMKAILNKAQYQKYYNREILGRQREQTIYKGDRRPQ